MSILDKFPEEFKVEPEFRVILEHVKTKGMKDKEELKDFFVNEIEILEKWVQENRRQGGAAVKEFREKVIRLGVLRKCEKLVQSFLF